MREAEEKHHVPEVRTMSKTNECTKELSEAEGLVC